MKIFSDEDITKQEICEITSEDESTIGVLLVIKCHYVSMTEIVLTEKQLLKVLKEIKKYKRGS